MQDNGPLIALIFFILFSIIFGIMAYLSHSELVGPDPQGQEGGEPTTKEYLIEQAQIENDKIELEIEAKRSEIEQKREEMSVQVQRGQMYEWEEAAYRMRYDQRRAWLFMVAGGELADGTKLKGFKQEAIDLAGRIGEYKNETESNIRREGTDIQERTEKQLREFQEKKDAAMARVQEEKKDYERKEKDFRVQKNYVQAELDELRRRLDALTQREINRAADVLDVDGKVILADVVNNTIVIDKGISDGVRDGFRFECFTIRAGNRKVHKAYLEVRKAGPTQSECLIMVKKVLLPRDPQSDYIAPEPEYRFSPYQESGKKGSSAAELSALPKEVVMAMNPKDPIVEGDWIANPFYDTKKKLTFYIAGSKDIVRGFQKSAVAYQWPHIERVVKSYGAEVVTTVDLGVDFIIAQKNPGDDPEFNKAVTLGIPVMFEWEMFRFLNQD